MRWRKCHSRSRSSETLRKPRCGSVLEVIVTEEIKIDHDKKIIGKTVIGDLYTERSLKLVRELAVSANIHKGYNILMDMIETETQPEMLDLMEIASECAKLGFDFNNKIDFLIPNMEERVRFAQLFKSCMETQGFKFMQFFEYDTAMKWLSDLGNRRGQDPP